MENLLTPDVVNQMFMMSGVLVTLKIVLIVWLLNMSWSLQINFGNYLKHTRPQSWLRKLWWSMCDNDGICDFCDGHVSKLWIWEKGFHPLDINRDLE